MDQPTYIVASESCPVGCGDVAYFRCRGSGDIVCHCPSCGLAWDNPAHAQWDCSEAYELRGLRDFAPLGVDFASREDVLAKGWGQYIFTERPAEAWWSSPEEINHDLMEEQRAAEPQRPPMPPKARKSGKAHVDAFEVLDTSLRKASLPATRSVLLALADMVCSLYARHSATGAQALQGHIDAMWADPGHNPLSEIRLLGPDIEAVLGRDPSPTACLARSIMQMAYQAASCDFESELNRDQQISLSVPYLKDLVDEWVEGSDVPTWRQTLATTPGRTDEWLAIGRDRMARRRSSRRRRHPLGGAVESALTKLARILTEPNPDWPEFVARVRAASRRAKAKITAFAVGKP